MINIVVAGAKGRMGGRITALIQQAPDLSLAGGIDAGDSLERVVDGADVIIDFTVAAAAAENAAIAAQRRRPIVIGTTGLSAAQQQAVREASRSTPIVFAPNMSIGVNVLFRLIDIAARTLGEDFRIDIEETHHLRKLDRPSGTAKKALEVALASRGLSPESDIMVFEEDATTGQGRSDAPLSVRSFRRGEVVGDHSIQFSSDSETLTIGHRALTRDVFARGALAAARWIVGKSAGLYGMEHVLGLAGR